MRASKKSFAAEEFVDAIGAGLGVAIEGVQDDVGTRWRLVRIVDPGHSGNLAASRSRIQAFNVAAFALLDRGSDIDQNERVATDLLPHLFTCRFVRADDSADDGAPMPDDL